MHVFRLYSDIDYVVFGDMERPRFNASDLKAMSKYDFGQLRRDLYGLWPGPKTRAELIEELLEVTTLDFYTKRYAHRTWPDLDSTYTLPGYSQDDAVKVLVLDTLPKELPAPAKDHLHHLLFDGPIRGWIMFRGELYRIEDLLEDLLDNPHQYVKEQVIVRAEDAYRDRNGVKDRKGLKEFIAFLDAELPDELLTMPERSKTKSTPPGAPGGRPQAPQPHNGLKP